MAKLRSTDLNGNLFVSGQLKLQRPFLISTDELITNLNADQLDGKHADDLAISTQLGYYDTMTENSDGSYTITKQTGYISGKDCLSKTIYKNGANNPYIRFEDISVNYIENIIGNCNRVDANWWDNTYSEVSISYDSTYNYLVIMLPNSATDTSSLNNISVQYKLATATTEKVEKNHYAVYNQKFILEHNKSEAERSANVWNEDLELGQFDWTTGEPAANDTRFRSKSFSRMKPSTNYFISSPNNIEILFYDSAGNYIYNISRSNTSFVTPNNTYYFKICNSLSNVYNNDIMINEGTKPLPYQPYNQNKHITNNEALFLKTEYDRSANLLDTTSSKLKETNESALSYSIGSITVDASKGNPLYGNGTFIIYDKLYPAGTYSIKLHITDSIEDVNSNKCRLLCSNNSINGIQNQYYNNYYYADFKGDENFKFTSNESFRLGFVFISETNSSTQIKTYSDIMLNEGSEPLPYQPYNQSKHITNNEAEFLKTESDRSANLLELININTDLRGTSVNINNGTITVSGTATGSGGRTDKLSDVISLEPGTYCFKAFGNHSILLCLSKSDNSFFTTADDIFTITETTELYFGINVTQGAAYNESCQVMLVKGSTPPTTYQPYEGKVVHEKDLDNKFGTFVTTDTRQEINALKRFNNGVALKRDDTGIFQTDDGANLAIKSFGRDLHFYGKSGAENYVANAVLSFPYSGENNSYTFTFPQKNGTIALTNDLNGYLPLSGGSLGGIVRGGAIDVHPENGGTIIGYYTNDLAFMLKRGGSCVAKNVTRSTSIAVNENWFDASPSYGGFTVTAVTDVVQIIIRSPIKYSWGTSGGIGFGAAAWRAKNVKIELGYSPTNTGSASNPDSDIVWVTRINVTNNSQGLVYTNNFTGPSVSEGGISDSSWSYIRITLTDWNNTTPRIAQIFSVNFGSAGMHNAFLSRSGGTVYGTITPYANNSYYLGSSTNKWAGVYSTTFYENGTALANKYVTTDTAQTISGLKTFKGNESNDISFVYNDNKTISGYGRHTAIRHALSFPWYNDIYQIGNIRGDSADSLGFGITKGNSELVARFVDTSNAYIGNNAIIHSGNIGSQNVNYANTAGSATDSTKLPLSGGTLTGKLYINASLNAPGSSDPSLAINYSTSAQTINDANLNMIKFGSLDNYIGEAPASRTIEGIPAFAFHTTMGDNSEFAWLSAGWDHRMSLGKGGLTLHKGKLTLSDDIVYKGAKSSGSVIKFMNNTADEWGNGIKIGGGGATIIGGGESASQTNVSAGDEVLYLMNDAGIDFYSNCQDGLSSAKHMTFDTAGTLNVPTDVVGTSTSNRLIFRHLDGQNCNGDYNLYLQYHQPNTKIYLNGSTYYIENGYYYNGISEQANLINPHQNISSTGRSTWDPTSSGKIIWGQKFANNTISNDTGDLTLFLRPSVYSSGATELCMNIDGDYYSMGTKLSRDGHTHNYLPLAGGTLTGTLGFKSNYLIKPVADYRTANGSRTGAITITLPADISNTMVSMWIDVYNYVTDTSFSVHVGGYTYSNNTWQYNPFAMVYGATHTVRLGHNGTNFVIYIGETNSTWSYPQISVRDVILGHQPAYDNWKKDWGISFSTSFSNVSATINHYAWTTKNFTPPTSLPANGGNADYAGSAGSANALNSLGRISCLSGASRYDSGLRMHQVYSNGYPFSYGSSITIENGFGAEIIFNGLGGGGNTGSGEMQFRTHSDWDSSEWGSWRTVIDSSNIGSQSVKYASSSHLLRTYSAGDSSHGEDYYLKCRHNVDGNERFKLQIVRSDGSVTHSTSVDYANSAGKADNISMSFSNGVLTITYK